MHDMQAFPIIDASNTSWRAIETSVGVAYAREETIWADNHHDQTAIVIWHNATIWKGEGHGCVNGTQSYFCQGIRAISNADVSLIGEEHAESLEAFVCFAVPFLVSGVAPPTNIGRLK